MNVPHGKSPFDDAVAVWHMADLNDSTGNSSALTIHGDVAVGVELKGAEREASIKRGGDGRAAAFNGGYLCAGQGIDGELNLTGKQMTICIRLRDTSEDWNSPLFGKYGGDNEVSYHLYCVDGSSKPFYGMIGGRKSPAPFYYMFGEEDGPRAIQGTTSVLEFMWGTEPVQEYIDELIRRKCGDPLLDEARKGIMRVNFPVASIGPADWHDVVVRFTGPKLELFIDGVLVDEEFPLGSMQQNSAPCLIGAASQDGEIKAGLHGLVDHAALWDRALSDKEITELSGGQEEVARREVEILGAEKDQMQYRRPRGHNSTLKHMYHEYSEKLWGRYGFSDAFNIDRDWFDKDLIGIDQGAAPLMIENHRSRLIRDHFMRLVPIQQAMGKVGFSGVE